MKKWSARKFEIKMRILQKIVKNKPIEEWTVKQLLKYQELSVQALMFPTLKNVIETDESKKAEENLKMLEKIIHNAEYFKHGVFCHQ